MLSNLFSKIQDLLLLVFGEFLSWNFLHLQHSYMFLMNLAKHLCLVSEVTRRELGEGQQTPPAARHLQMLPRRQGEHHRSHSQLKANKAFKTKPSRQCIRLWRGAGNSELLCKNSKSEWILGRVCQAFPSPGALLLGAMTIQIQFALEPDVSTWGNVKLFPVPSHSSNGFATPQCFSEVLQVDKLSWKK